jgi:hypothetical protein
MHLTSLCLCGAIPISVGIVADWGIFPNCAGDRSHHSRSPCVGTPATFPGAGVPSCTYATTSI